MDINNKKIIFVLAFKCQYSGNIITSLEYVADYLTKKYNVIVSWVFPYQQTYEWLEELQNKYSVFFFSRSYKKSKPELVEIFRKCQPDIVHTHYEQLDIPVARAITQLGLKTKMVWHVHDIMALHVQGESFPIIHYLYRKLRYALRYAYWGKNAYYLSVSAEMAAFTGHFRNHWITNPPTYNNEELLTLRFPRVEVLINGIDCRRLTRTESNKQMKEKFCFLSFGGNFKGKGIDVILRAGCELAKKRNDFEICLTVNKESEIAIKDFFLNKGVPQWVRMIPSSPNVAEIFAKADCYISASRGETMSTSIAEASILGLPVIQSDIPGTYWNAHHSSTFLFPLNDESALAIKMNEVMEIPSDRLKDLCRKTSRENRIALSLDTWRDKLIAVYKRL